MCTKSVNELVAIFRDITSNKTCNIRSICAFEKRAETLTGCILKNHGEFSLEYEFSEDLLSLIRMAYNAPSDYKLSYWLEFGVPKEVLSLEQKINVILGGFFNLAV